MVENCGNEILSLKLYTKPPLFGVDLVSFRDLLLLLLLQSRKKRLVCSQFVCVHICMNRFFILLFKNPSRH